MIEFLERLNWETRRMTFLMIVNQSDHRVQERAIEEAQSDHTHMLLKIVAMLVWILRQSQLQAQECLVQVKFRRHQNISKHPFKANNSMLCQWPPHRLKRQKFTLRLMKKMSGLPSKNSILFYITKNKSKLFSEIRKERD